MKVEIEWLRLGANEDGGTIVLIIGSGELNGTFGAPESGVRGSVLGALFGVATGSDAKRITPT